MAILKRGSETLVFNERAGKSPRIIFCPGFNSNRQGNKALAIEEWCAAHDHAFTRFDYSAHGDSSGDFGDGCISAWLADTLAIIDGCEEQDVLLVGSSMGGWISLLAAPQRPDKVCGLLLLACAADMTKAYPARIAGLQAHYDSQNRKYFLVDNQYDDQQPYRIYQNLIDDGEQHALLTDSISITVPVRLIHGMLDDVVEWQRSVQVAQSLDSSSVEITLLKNGDHRLSDSASIASMLDQLHRLLAIV